MSNFSQHSWDSESINSDISNFNCDYPTPRPRRSKRLQSTVSFDSFVFEKFVEDGSAAEESICSQTDSLARLTTNFVVKDDELPGLESQFEKDPENYDVLIKLIILYEKKKNEKLDSTRTYMRRLYPLPEFIWLSWVKSLAKQTSRKDTEGLKRIIDLIRQSFDDFLC